jgi:predicted aminopeptidase
MPSMLRTLALILLIGLGGCYLARQAMGQARILLTQRSIDGLLQDPSVPVESRRKLLLVREVKAFGEREMGLASSRNYEDYYDTSGRPITYVVTACAKDAFRPHTWWFPVVGEVPYKGFFDREDAVAEAKALAGLGLDVSLGAAAAYSTLGYFPDPVLSSMLDYPDEELAALLLHELTHGTLYLPGGTDFNEGLASFTGWQGALEFARARGGTESILYERTAEGFARSESRDRRALDLYERLSRLYSSGKDRAEILAERDRIFGAHRRGLEEEAARLAAAAGKLAEAPDLGRVPALPHERARAWRAAKAAADEARRAPGNNAEVLQLRRYGRYDEFRARFEAAGGNWRSFFAGLKSSSP